MTERTNWSLHRIGWIETNFILHEHLEVITIGRNCEADKQCLGECIIVNLYKWNCFLIHLSQVGKFLVGTASYAPWNLPPTDGSIGR